ncbi:MAG: hypothetical protein ACKO3T_25505 [Planctomycetaceae bacterium]
MSHRENFWGLQQILLKKGWLPLWVFLRKFADRCRKCRPAVLMSGQRSLWIAAALKSGACLRKDTHGDDR